MPNLRERMRSELKTSSGTAQFHCDLRHPRSTGEALALSDNVVLMRSGLIEQQGTPEEVFKDPQTLFAAQFLGYTNHFRGRVRTLEDAGKVTVELDAGIVVSAVWRSSGAGNVGDAVVIAIRGDRVGLRPSESAGDGDELIGVVEVGSFLGTYISYVVKIGDLTFNVEAPVDSVFSRGDRVSVGLPPAHCHAYLASDVSASRSVDRATAQ